MTICNDLHFVTTWIYLYKLLCGYCKGRVLNGKEAVRKNEGIMVYHAIQSFAKDEVTLEQPL